MQTISPKKELAGAMRIIAPGGCGQLEDVLGRTCLYLLENVAKKVLLEGRGDHLFGHALVGGTLDWGVCWGESRYRKEYSIV